MTVLFCSNPNGQMTVLFCSNPNCIFKFSCFLRCHQLLREQGVRHRVGVTDEGMDTRHFPAHERQDLVQQLEATCDKVSINPLLARLFYVQYLSSTPLIARIFHVGLFHGRFYLIVRLLQILFSFCVGFFRIRLIVRLLQILFSFCVGFFRI